MIGGQGKLFGRSVTSFIAFLPQPDGCMSVAHGASSDRSLTQDVRSAGPLGHRLWRGVELARRDDHISLSSTLSRTGTSGLVHQARAMPVGCIPADAAVIASSSSVAPLTSPAAGRPELP